MQTVTLADGSGLPQVGLGFWKVDPQSCATLVRDAAEAGYRHFDCACDYGNESEVGDGLRGVLADGLCRRDELWVTSKLWNTYHRAEHVRLACERSLRDLKLEVLDLYLIHFPIAQEFVPFEVRYPPGWFHDPEAAEPRVHPARVPIMETWGAMQELKRAGLVKNIGVCNFGVSLLRDLINSTDDPPAVLQVEMHPYLAQPRLLRFCAEQGIACTAFSPLGALSYHAIGMASPEDSLLELPLIREIAAARARTPAQIVLRWGVQRGAAVVPKTSRPERLRENLSLFDFSLTNDEMRAIDGLDCHRRYNVFCEKAFNTFFPIYD